MWRTSESQLLSEAILNLDLSFIEKRLVQKQNWASKDAQEAIRRYRNFLFLIVKYPSEPLAPAPDVDEVWHTHILFTQEYMQACNAIFGSYLHHTPANEESEELMHTAQSNTSALYRKEFNEPYLHELDIASFW